MNSRLFASVLGFALIATAGVATAQGPASGLYIGGVIGIQGFSDNEDEGVDVEIDTGFVIGGLIGYRFASLRTEAELNYQDTEAEAEGENIDAEILRYTAGIYYDFTTLSLPITPYIGGGLGLASIDATGEVNDETNFTWHGELGGSFDLGPQLAVVPAYRYEWIDDKGLEVDDAVTSHAFRLGLRWSF